MKKGKIKVLFGAHIKKKSFLKRKFETNNFSLDKLQFTLKVVNVTEELKYIVLTKIEYDRNELTSKKSDTLVRERFTLL